MCKLGISVISTPNGVHPSEGEALLRKGELQYAYEWLLTDIEWANQVLAKVTERVLPGAELMQPGELHCTSHVSWGHDGKYEQSWFASVAAETLKTSEMFWSGEKCALRASLADSQLSQYTIADTAPHISLSKSVEETWAELGLFTKQCVEAEDWTQTVDPCVMFSSSVNAYRQTFPFTVPVQRTTAPILNEQMVDCFASIEQT